MHKHYMGIIASCILFMCLQNQAAVEFNVKNFGAVGDGTTLNTRTIQKAIDSCSKVGGGTVLFNGGSFMSGTIYLKSNVTLKIDSGATLLGSGDLTQYTTDTYKCMYNGESYMDRCFIFAQNANNIGLIGKGTINGSGASFSSTRPMMIRFVSCSTVTVKDLHLLNPASYTSVFHYCKKVTCDGLNISSRVQGNGDGNDFDGCEDVVVSNCTYNTSDDAICLQTSRKDKPCRRIKIFNCTTTYTSWAGMRIGLLSVGDYDSVEVSNCRFTKTGDAAFKIQICEGARMSNFNFHDIEVINSPRITFMTLNSYRFSRLEVEAGRALPAITSEPFRNIKFTNIKLTNPTLQDANSFILITGIPGNTVNNIEFSGISFVAPGGGTSTTAAKRNLPEITGKRPEVSVIGTPLPAYGAYLHHTRNIVFRHSEFRTLTTDARAPVLGEDADSTKFINVRMQGTPVCPNNRISSVTNIAQNAVAGASSTNGQSANAAGKATDGDIATGWKAANTDNEWIMVDLGARYAINTIVLWWNTDYAGSYKLQVSNDNTGWTDVFSTDIVIGGINHIPVNADARYLKMLGVKRGTTSAYSLNEIEAYGSLSTTEAQRSMPSERVLPAGNKGEDMVVYTLTGAKVRTTDDLRRVKILPGVYFVMVSSKNMQSARIVTLLK